MVYSVVSKKQSEDDTSCEAPLLSVNDLSLLNKNKIPRHVGIIMDGNRRWAINQDLYPIAGHWKGVDVLMDAVQAASEMGIETLTVYAFSTENWKRSPEEVKVLLQLFEVALLGKRESMVERGVQLHHIGDTDPFPESFIEVLNETEELTKNSSKINLVLALNYGGRDEICRAINKLRQEIPISTDVNEDLLKSYLDTAEWEDPAVIIRTSGEHRLSNFLLWQASYSEVIFSGTLWPEFTPHRFLEAIIEYQRRERRHGT